MTLTSPTVPLVFRYGLHRVRDAVRVLPQAAWSVESQPDLCGGRDYELLIDVERLNIDAASFRQMEEAARSVGEDIEAGVRRQILDTVHKRGKMHNPMTGSGGMLLGRVRHVGGKLPDPHASLRPGERVATLVSLSLTPLQIERILSVNLHAHQVSILGTAIGSKIRGASYGHGRGKRLRSGTKQPGAVRLRYRHRLRTMRCRLRRTFALRAENEAHQASKSAGSRSVARAFTRN